VSCTDPHKARPRVDATARDGLPAGRGNPRGRPPVPSQSAPSAGGPQGIAGRVRLVV